MSFADCTSCLRRHKRPANSKCEFLKVAVEKCGTLGLSSSQYMQYLSELLPEDVDPKMEGRQTKDPVSPVAQTQFDNAIIAQLVSESIQSRKLFESSQAQVERMMAQLLDLKLPDRPRGRQAVPPFPRRLTTMGLVLPRPILCLFHIFLLVSSCQG